MSDKLVVVIEYDIDPNATLGQPLAEALDQLRLSELTKRPHIKLVQVHAAIKSDAKRVIAIVNQEAGPDPDRCTACGESEGKCARRGMWTACCHACEDSDRRTHLGTVL